jgi:glycosyltransferase involved in cell wall biosynthesis
MSTVSLCMIVKNEADNLPRCLKSTAGAVDELIVVDTGSTDNSLEIAKSFGARVSSFPWNGNFSAARNASLANASGDWILFLDADEELTPESARILRQITATPAVEGYFVKILNYLGNENWNEVCPDLVFRLFRNRPAYRFRGAIHEQIVDVILEQNQTARYQTAENLIIRHYGYLNQAIEAKDKKNRNLRLIQAELERDPQNRLLRYHYGVELYRAERFDEAAVELHQAANGIDPAAIYLPKLLRYLVLAYQGAGCPEQALETVRIGLSLFPNYADLYYYGGLSHLEQRDYVQAYHAFRQAAAMPEQPCYYASFSGIRGFRAYYQLGQLAEVFLNPEEALKYYIHSLGDNPAFAPALRSIVRLLKPQDDPEYARQCLEKICDFCTPQAQLWLGQILFQESAYALALQYLESGSAGPQVPGEVKLWRAICLCQQRRFLEALHFLKEFPPADPLYPLALLNQLLCFWIQGNRRKTLSLARQLQTLGLSEDTAAVISLLTHVLPQQQKIFELTDSQGQPIFLAWAKRLLKRGQDSGKPAKTAGVRLGPDGISLLLDILLRLIDLNESALAESLLNRLDPEVLSGQAGAIGQLYYRYQRLDEACQYLRFYAETHPESAAALYDLAEVERDRGNAIHAETLYRQALALDPKEPRFYIALIRLYQKLRRELLEEAVAQFPEIPVLQKLLREAQEQ